MPPAYESGPPSRHWSHPLQLAEPDTLGCGPRMELGESTRLRSRGAARTPQAKTLTKGRP